MATIRTPRLQTETTGWLEIKLNKYEVKYCWDCIEASGKKKDAKPGLTGQLNSSYHVEDKDGVLMKKIIRPAIKAWDEIYGLELYIRKQVPQQELVVKDEDGQLLKRVAIPFEGIEIDYKLHSWWVNYQKATDYNPVHNHGGLFSFALWLKEPTSFDEQKLKENAKGSSGSRNYVFDFHFPNKLGQLIGASYELGPEDEGTMLFFPAHLHHSVHPFYEIDEFRVSMAGNIVNQLTLSIP
jgi:hypothetical protein